MKLLNYIFLFSIVCVLFSSCKNDKIEPLIDATIQAEREEQIIQQYLTENNLTAQKTNLGIYYIVLEEGTGTLKPIAKNGVTINYVGTVLYGRKFDSSYEKGKPLSFTIGSNTVIVGFEEAVKQMKLGEKTRFFIPSRYAYEESGIPSAGIPPYSTLIFDIKLEKIL